MAAEERRAAGVRENKSAVFHFCARLMADAASPAPERPAAAEDRPQTPPPSVLHGPVIGSDLGDSQLNPINIDELMSESESEPEDAGSPRPSTFSLRPYFTRASAGPSELRRTVVPLFRLPIIHPFSELCMRSLSTHDYEIQPPFTIGRALDPAPFFNKTNIVGQYLIRRNFPIIGRGKTTLVFLLADDTVAKVPHHANGPLYERHCRDRVRDVAMSERYPDGYAKTLEILVWIDLPTEPCATVISEKMFVQEHLVGDFAPHGLHIPPLHLQEMCRNNPDIKQFGRRADGTLVGYDYE